jgi:glycosyltransferase involved in cell wall biosynthesis
MQHVLSNYPLSGPFRRRLEEVLGVNPAYLSVSELRDRSIRRLLLALVRIHGDRLTVAVEEESSNALLPVLSMLASVTRAQSLQLVDASLQPRSLSRARVAAAALQLGWESVLAAGSLLRARRDLRSLLAEPRVEARRAEGRRVAYLNCNLWFGVKSGGSVGHISGVANALMDHGYDLDFFSVGGRLMVDDRARHVALQPPRMLALPFETTYYRFHGMCVDQISRNIAGRSTTFIYQRMSLGNYTGVVLSRRHRIPLVLEYNGSEVWVARNWGRPLKFHQSALMAENACLRHAHAVVTVSEVLGRELIERGVEPGRIVVYPNCIDPVMFDPERFGENELRGLRTELGFGPDDTIATFVGTFGQWHGAEVLAAAIRAIVERRRDLLDAGRLRFLLVGDGQTMPLVRRTLCGTGADAYVHMTGLVPQRDAPRYLAMSDILLSPHVANADGSAFFGSPTKLYEYMAMGRAILASDLDQIGEVLRPAVHVSQLPDSQPAHDSRQVAVLACPGSVDDLVDGLAFLCRERTWRRSLGANARSVAMSRYTWKHHVGAIVSRVTELT